MAKVAVMLADGFEEIEAVTIIDVLRRGGVDTVAVGLDKLPVIGTHNLKVQADITLCDLDADSFDMIVLPGGYGGMQNLSGSPKMIETIKKFDKNGKFIAAICAAPIVLSVSEVIKGKFTCYPSCESGISGGEYVADQNVVIDGKIITSRGPATAMEFALELVKILNGERVYKEVRDGLLFVK